MYNLYLGDGKSHYIKYVIEVKKWTHLTIPVNEGFDVQRCIQKLNCTSQNSDECMIHINFTLPFIKVCLSLTAGHNNYSISCPCRQS